MFVVMSAKADTQALNGIARSARDFKIYLWVTDPRQVTFLCLSKEKSPKEMTPRSARRFTNRSGPLRSSPHRALANSPGAEQRASSSNTGSLEYSRWGCGTRRALRGLAKLLFVAICKTSLYIYLCGRYFAD